MLPDSFSFAQLLGYAALASSLIGYQFRSHKALYTANFATDVMWIIHYLALGGIMPVVSGALSALRTIFGVFLFPNHRAAVSIAAFIIVTLICVLTNVYGSKGYLVLIATGCFSLAVVWCENYRINRTCMAAGAFSWMVVGFVYGSIGEVISSAISMGSIGIA
jgi:hypothetical protein